MRLFYDRKSRFPALYHLFNLKNGNIQKIDTCNKLVMLPATAKISLNLDSLDLHDYLIFMPFYSLLIMKSHNPLIMVQDCLNLDSPDSHDYLIV